MLKNVPVIAKRNFRLAAVLQFRNAITEKRPSLRRAFSQPWPPIHTTNSSPGAHFHSKVEESLSVQDDTIYALSTAPGRAGIAVVRISGPACLHIYIALCHSKPSSGDWHKCPKPRYASLRSLHDPLNTSNILDSNALVIYFPAPHTVTGEEVLELHIHGGPATVKAVLSAIPQCSSKNTIRYAEPGEFTKRAFQNNKLDLAQVEALSDILSAETEQQRRAAVRGHSGKLGRTYEKWRKQLLYARGELEALIDFSEDQHFDESPAELLSNVTVQVKAMLNSIASHEEAGQRGELLKKGIRISLLGPPNAGKSSLLNLIVGREASIVSQEAGTTRDIVEVSLDMRGFLCTFADTAGLRSESESSEISQSAIGDIEQEGIRRAKAKAGESDVVIVLASMQDSKPSLQHSIQTSTQSAHGFVQVEDGIYTIAADLDAVNIAKTAPQSVIVINKVDVNPHGNVSSLEIAAFREAIDDYSTPIVPISCKEAQEQANNGGDPGNIKQLIDQLVDIFKNMTSLPVDMEDLLGVTERQRQLLATCAQHLNLFIEEAQERERECDIVLAAEHLRSAANCLSRITGRGEAGDVEEVLGVVFEKFCVGK